MKKQTFYGKIENGKLEIYDGVGYSKTLANMQGEVVIEIARKGEQRTIDQNSAMHLYFTQLAEALNDSGFDLQKFLKVDVPWTPALVKELLWRPIQELVLKKKSTTELSKLNDIDKVYTIVDKAISERTGVHIEFPSIDTAIDREREPEKIKCSGCGHGPKFHYRSDVDISRGQIFCSKDNCTGWQRCDQDGWDEKLLLGKNK